MYKKTTKAESVFFEIKMKKVAVKFGGNKKCSYLCNRLQEVRAFSSAGLEHLPYKQRVGGSNPSTPTMVKVFQQMLRDLFFMLLNYFITIFSVFSR